MRLAARPWRVDTHIHIIGSYWTSLFYTTKEEADRFVRHKNADDNSLTYAKNPVVDHKNSLQNEHEIIRTIVRKIEEERCR